MNISSPIGGREILYPLGDYRHVDIDAFPWNQLNG
jgi:hypothetical protein